MIYEIEEWKVSELIRLITNKEVNLSPPYQRNFIWSPNDQRSLIDSILKGYPIPNFFLFKRDDGKFEMVDGQQRSRTIMKFWNDLLTDSSKNTIHDIPNEIFLNYKLSFIVISKLSKDDSLESFYALVNKSGKHLNKPELFKAQYHDKLLLSLVEELLNDQDFINLELFTDASSKRMNDRSYIEELVSYLKFDISDKKDIIEKFYEQDITESEYESLKNLFQGHIGRISILNEKKQINKTRYKQKNDFFTLFCFVDKHSNLSDDILIRQYEILLAIQPFISPSNDDCLPFRDYAINCVSQSNSKKARLSRLNFFEDLLLNNEQKGNQTIIKVLDYFDQINEGKVQLVQVGEYLLLDAKSIEKLAYDR